ncbi:MAG: hypothetical protein JW951_02420, partial [Lentisphaerae bacterium]|nr:hypothetical protein [Lentisphaerota bacterium]
MKTFLRCLGPGLIMLILASSARAGNHAIAVGGRYYNEHSEFEELPYGDGDIGYGLAYAYHDAAAFWQVAAVYTPDVTGAEGVDYTLTPQINLVLKDRLWRAGVGALCTYLSFDSGEDDWTDVYWQLMLGIGLPVFGMQLETQAFYLMESWSDIDAFDV